MAAKDEPRRCERLEGRSGPLKFVECLVIGKSELEQGFVAMESCKSASWRCGGIF